MNDYNIEMDSCSISGICAFIQLKQQLGIKATVFELNKGTGGTWFKNAYPGCSCDVASHVYSFSFELNPGTSNRIKKRNAIYQLF
jgi:cation diffusion facilitator CzcD-associated flavoprotein CzcO